MSNETITTLIAVISGGGLTALVGLIFDYSKKKREMNREDVDSRIVAWQKISDKNEERITNLEKKLEECYKTIKNLKLYILELEKTILRAKPPLELPEWPST